MVSFLTTRDISSAIDRIIKEAKYEVYIISPYFKVSQNLMDRLHIADSRNVKINIIYGKSDLRQEMMESFLQLKNVSIYFLENLHAKCYFNDSKMVITSMNLYDSSEMNNFEMGVLIEKSTDPTLYQDARDEVIEYLRNPHIQVINPKKYFNFKSNNSGYQQSKANAHCIRCNIPIPFNMEKPYCNECLSVWSSYQNPDYQENVCHVCGNPNPSSMNKPCCTECYYNRVNVSEYY